MDDNDFEDLFAETDLLEDSSQESLIFTATNLTVANSSHAHGHAINDYVLDKIETIFEQIAHSLLHDKGELIITLKNRQTAYHRQPSARASGDRDGVPVKYRRICFPGKTAEEAWRFTVLVRILELIHEALRNNVVLSKRDIYYRDPALFGNQSHVDRYLDDIAFSFGVPRARLNVSAASKGILTGAIRLCRRDGSTIDRNIGPEGMLVPDLKDILSADMTTVKWILAIEKEASFRSIAASSFWSTIAEEGIVVTGKGYPDIATRAFLHFLSTPSPRNGFASPPVYCLVDFDPDGLAILSVYKHGSLALPHENDKLRVPQLQWLGLRSEHFPLQSTVVHENQGLLGLTLRDRRNAVKMLERTSASESDEEDVECRHALQTMLMLNLKAELQLLDAEPEAMANLLKSQLSVEDGKSNLEEDW